MTSRECFSKARFTNKLILAFELLGPLSLVIQAVYLIAKPRFDDEAWRLGIGFALLLCLLGSSPWVAQNGYCRILLPLTFSFNFLLHKHEPRTRFAAWYVAGNVGMDWKCLKYLKNIGVIAVLNRMNRETVFGFD